MKKTEKTIKQELKQQTEKRENRLTKQINKPSGNSPTSSPTPIVEPVKPQPKPTAVWSQEMENQYDIFGLPPEDGETIEIVKRPIIRNGAVEQKGVAKRKSSL